MTFNETSFLTDSLNYIAHMVLYSIHEYYITLYKKKIFPSEKAILSNVMS